MTHPIERIKAHYDAAGIQRIEVPEWGEAPEKPLVIYYRPITLAEKQQLYAIGEREGPVARLADCLILKALNADGSKMFTLEHKFSLRHHADPDVLARVVVQMMASPGVAEMGKDSPPTRS